MCTLLFSVAFLELLLSCCSCPKCPQPLPQLSHSPMDCHSAEQHHNSGGQASPCQSAAAGAGPPVALLLPSQVCSSVCFFPARSAEQCGHGESSKECTTLSTTHAATGTAAGKPQRCVGFHVGSTVLLAITITQFVKHQFWQPMQPGKFPALCSTPFSIFQFVPCCMLCCNRSTLPFVLVGQSEQVRQSFLQWWQQQWQWHQ